MLDIRKQIKTLTHIGVALTSEHDLNKLLELIVREARALTNADGGSLYIKEGSHLQFVVSQNETLERRLRERGLADDNPFKPFPLEISNESIAGYVANNAEALNIPDVRAIPSDEPYKWSSSFDENNDYYTKSMLVVPMLDLNEDVIGVLQLINARSWDETGRPSDQVVGFDSLQEEMIRSLASQAAVAISNARLTASIKGAHLDTIYRLSVAAEYKDQDTASHIKRMSLYSKILAESGGMRKEEVELVLYASPMHDVGKLGVPDAILLKPGKLDSEEWKIMQKHTVYGANILEGSDSEILEWSREIAISHHEKWDGTGYPNKLKAEDIPITGRIVALADVFDALTSNRPYKKAWTIDRAREEIIKQREKHFDPQLVDVFMDVFDRISEVYEQYRD